MAIFRAVWNKELAISKSRFKSISYLIIMILFPLIILFSGYAKINQTSSAIKTTLSLFYIGYCMIYTGLITGISNLKFWEEKSGGTIDSLLALPFHAKTIFLAKLSFPIFVSSLMSLIVGLVASTLYGLSFKISFHPVILLVEFILSVVICYGFSSLMGVVMWSMNKTSASAAQILSYLVIFGGFGGILAVENPRLNIFLFSLFVLATIISIGGTVAVLCLKTEKIVSSEI